MRWRRNREPEIRIPADPTPDAIVEIEMPNGEVRRMALGDFLVYCMENHIAVRSWRRPPE